MEEFIIYIVILMFSYASYCILILNSNKKIEKYKKSSEVLYLIRKYKIDLKKVNFKKMARVMALANSFILANTVFIASFFESWIIKVLISFILITPMILVVYHLLGTHYSKKDVK
jgi:hypothetical protein